MSKQVLTSQEFADSYLARLVDMQAHPELYIGYSTGLKALDQLTGGIVRNTYLVFAGQAGTGKTALMLTAMKALGKAGERFLFMGLEENTFQTGQRMYAHVSGISRVTFRDVGMEAGDWPKIYKAHEELAGYQGYWGYGVYNVERLYQLVDELGITILGVDYVQLMNPLRVSNNRAQEISQISASLKQLIMREVNPITVIANSQLNDEGKALWSRDIYRDCDTFITVNDVLDATGKPYENRKILRAEKSRHSRAGEVEVAFNGELSLFADLEERLAGPNLSQIVKEYLDASVK